MVDVLVTGGSTLAVVLLLCLDTATPAVSVGLIRVPSVRPGVEVVAQRVEPAGRGHGERLTPAITALLAEAGVRAGDLDALVVGVGPGPFTGLRIGIATAAAFGDAIGRPVYAVCSLDAIARSQASPPALVATDARRREVYWATYDETGRRTSGPAVGRPADVAARLGLAEITLAGPPTPAGLAAAADADGVFDRPPQPLTPLYLRRPDAAEPHRPKQVTPA